MNQMKAACKQSSCTKPHKAHGLCAAHYRKHYYRQNKIKELARTHAFKRSFHGRILVAYQKLRLRCEGRSPLAGYTGLPFLAQADFYEWSVSSTTYQALFTAWDESGFAYRLTPSVDRIDSNKGYTLDNIQWLPLHENSRKG